MPRKPRIYPTDRADSYGTTERLQHYVCFHCQKTFKQPVRAEPPKCPQCQQPMTNMGTDFKAPTQNNVKQWRKVKALVQAGVKFFPSYSNGLPGKRPATLSELPAFLKQIRPPTEGQKILLDKKKPTLAPKEGKFVQHGHFPHQTYTLLGLPLKSGSAVELFHSGQWQPISFICRGNGNVAITQPYAYPRIGNTIFHTQPPLFLTEKHHLRWPN